MHKTNAMRILDKAGVSYRIAEYTVDESDLSGVHIADEVGMPYSCVFKTLVARGDKSGIIVLCVPVDKELDMKKVARASGNKRVEMVHVKELLGLTGYIRGGCSPIGMKKKYPTYIDRSAKEQKEIAVSAGIRGEQVILPPQELLKCTDAAEADITMREETV